ncbi:unnamed protein product [Paramecium sonneborni]|uniref:Uncharacterized protein n=1 Tax=Paramecium sonneborni TaxID=65129 RepID=A0A8S1RBZ7_9CILI|nr:unnamed protein product [Paramecium sonneborni]
MNSKYFSPKANQQFFESLLKSPREVKLYRIRFDTIFNEYVHRKVEHLQLEPILQTSITEPLKEKVEKRKRIYQKRHTSTQLSPLSNFHIQPSPQVKNMQRYISRGRRTRKEFQVRKQKEQKQKKGSKRNYTQNRIRRNLIQTMIFQQNKYNKIKKFSKCNKFNNNNKNLEDHKEYLCQIRETRGCIDKYFLKTNSRFIDNFGIRKLGNWREKKWKQTQPPKVSIYKQFHNGMITKY